MEVALELSPQVGSTDLHGGCMMAEYTGCSVKEGEFYFSGRREACEQSCVFQNWRQIEGKKESTAVLFALNPLGILVVSSEK